MHSFKSKFEKKIWNDLKRDFPNVKYEPDSYKYIQPEIQRTYTPDYKTGSKKVYLEAKGKLDLDTRKKMVWFKEYIKDVVIIFVFMNPDTKIRKGSKTTYGDWATKQGFIWLDARKHDWTKQYKELLKNV